MGATMDAYLNGYKDPRLATYFKPCEDGLYHGVRNGIAAISKEYYLGMSVPNVDKTTPVRWLMSSEVALLRAAAASSSRSSRTAFRPPRLQPTPRAS